MTDPLEQNKLKAPTREQLETSVVGLPGNETEVSRLKIEGLEGIQPQVRKLDVDRDLAAVAKTEDQAALTEEGQTIEALAGKSIDEEAAMATEAIAETDERMEGLSQALKYFLDKVNEIATITNAATVREQLLQYGVTTAKAEGLPPDANYFLTNEASLKDLSTKLPELGFHTDSTLLENGRQIGLVAEKDGVSLVFLTSELEPTAKEEEKPAEAPEATEKQGEEGLAEAA